MLRMMILPTAFLTLTSCVSGDFCEVWQGYKTFDPTTATAMVETDRPDVEGIAVENAYGKKYCE